MNEEDKAKAIERANSYRQMMDMWAWKEFYSFLKEVRQNALEGAIYSSEISDVQLHRGRVKCIDQIEGELGSILEMK